MRASRVFLGAQYIVKDQTLGLYSTALRTVAQSLPRRGGNTGRKGACCGGNWWNFGRILVENQGEKTVRHLLRFLQHMISMEGLGGADRFMAYTSLADKPEALPHE